VDRILGQPIGIIAIGMATGNREDACASKSPIVCVTLLGTRESVSLAVSAATNPRRRSAAFSNGAPPSELACRQL
jgi:hypothetical protein